MSLESSLGVFSVSLAVKDINASRDFYTKLGFVITGGDLEQGWLVMAQGGTKVGLFQGMFDSNLMTFNPGWDNEANALARFEDVRQLQARLQAAGLELTKTTDPKGTGPAHIALVDPDGNAILIDQHVPKPQDV